MALGKTMPEKLDDDHESIAVLWLQVSRSDELFKGEVQVFDELIGY